MAYGNEFYDDDDEDEDELMAQDGSALKDAVLICIDASTSMQTLRPAEALGLTAGQGEPAETSFFAGALDCAFSLEKRKAFVSPGDYVGIVVYNTTKAIDEHPDAEPSGIFVLHTLGPIDVERCRLLKDMVEKSKVNPAAFRRVFPPMDSDHEHRVTPADLFSYASTEMRTANLKKGNRRIFLITDDDDPCRIKAEREEAEASQRLTPRKKKTGIFGRFQGPEHVTDLERTSDRIRDFMQLGAEVIPFFLAAEDAEFDVNKFWAAALMRNFSAEGASAYGGMTAFQDLLAGLTVRQSTKRGIFTIPLTIAEDVVIGVKGFALLMEAKKPSTMALNTDGDRPVEVHRQTTYFDAKAGQELNPASYTESIRYVFQNGIVGAEDVPPEFRRQDEENAKHQDDLRPMDIDGSEDEAGPSTKIEVKDEASNGQKFDLAWGVGLKKKKEETTQPMVTYTKAELDQIGSCGLKPGIRVLGYQSRSCVSFERNVRTPYFLRPTEEKFTLGSTRTFVAFMRCMLDRELVAIALCVFRAKSTPTVCALVPQEETFIPAGDPNGSQDKPPGIHVIPFPFLDDMREYPQTIQNGGALVPDEQHVQIMQKIIKKLTARAGYNPEDIPNPTLARYFAELEARAFQDEFDGEQIEDRSLPIADVMKQRAGDLLVQFKESISMDERAFMAAPTAPTKRKTTATDVPAAKKQKAAPDEEEPDMADVRAAWKAGKLSKFTVKQLRPFLRHHTGTHPTGLKADLVAAVQTYFDKGEQ